MVSALRKAMVKTQSKACGEPPQALLRKPLNPLFPLDVLIPQSWNLNGGAVDFVFVPFFATGNLGSVLDGTGVTSGTVPLVTPVRVTALCTIAVITVAGVANCEVLRRGRCGSTWLATSSWELP
jgi:hypothetical protein